MNKITVSAMLPLLLTIGCKQGFRDTTGERQAIQIDHVIWAVPDLERGVAILRDLSGVEAITGGIHPGRGTHNSLISAGDNMYVEIIAPDPDQMPFDPEEHPVEAFASTISQMPGPEVDMFAVATPDLDVLAARAKELGLDVVGPNPGERRTPEGALIRWSHVDFVGHGFGQFVPFALNWLDSPHPSTTSPTGVKILGITVEHPRADELRRIYEGLGIPAEVVRSDEPRILVRMTSDRGPFELTSGTSLLAYYAARSGENIN
jgi:hypothetical protein